MRVWLSLACLVPGLTACAGLQYGADMDRTRTPPGPEWRLDPHDSPAVREDVVATHDEDVVPRSRVYSSDPVQLRREVADACSQKSVGDGRNLLRSIVADLHFSAVDPAAATEALLLGQCGKSRDVIEEIAAQVGVEGRDAVTQRAVSVLGPSARRRVERAVAVGLARQAELAEAEQGVEGDPLPAYGMFYLPSSGSGRRLDASMALNRLFEEAEPGYGIYTFVLVGHDFSRLNETDAAPYRELFRLIETYVATMPDAGLDPSVEDHVFLVPVDPRRGGASLADLVSTDLSDLMRRQLRQALRREGHKGLAARLETGKGPFLVATLEPSLRASSAKAPRLLADLSAIGPEYLYGVVDAFDRPIPVEFSGDAKSLSLIRERLSRLRVESGTQDGAAPTSETSWIIMLGHFAAEPRLSRAAGLACVILHPIEQQGA